MSQQFYIAVNGQQTGPFSYDEIKTKNIQRDTLVWTEGLDNWTKAEDIELLKELLQKTPPPIPGVDVKPIAHTTPPPVIPDSKPVGRYFGYELARRRERLFAVIIQDLIFMIPILLLFGEDLLADNPFNFESIIGSAILSAVLGAIFYSMWGGNLGHKIMGLQVISSITGEVQNNAKTGAIRETLKSVFSVFLIPLIWLLWDDNKQNLYDKVVRTYVVKKKK